MTAKEGLHKTKEGLPEEAFAIVSDPEDIDTWKLPHHEKSILRALRGKLDIEQTVDWGGVDVAVAVLSPRKRGEQRIEATPETIIEAARHLAAHYRKADRPLPDILAALI